VRVAALYDIHGMLDALDAALEDVGAEEPDAIVLGGDVVGGPQPREVLERLRALGDRTLWVRGNADRALVEGEDFVDDDAAGALAWTRAQLSAADIAFLGSLPPVQILEIEELGRVLFCHAVPASDLPIVTEATPDEHLRRLLAGVEADVVVSGHTHMQFDRTVEGVRWINAGSIGMPYEGEVAAFWALIGPEVTLRKTPYDVEAAAERVLATGWPDAEAFVNENMRTAIAREEAIPLFERRAVERGER
jgi:putative phosphoesterase